MTTKALRVAWLGETTGSCSELLERITRECTIRGRELQVTQLGLDQWNDEVARNADHLVLSCPARLDYPWQTIAALQSTDAIVPWGVVTGTWCSGSRRTGIGTVTHWQSPWYRWWDGWRGWFFPELASASSLCAAQYETVAQPVDYATPRLAATVLPHRSTSQRPPSQKTILESSANGRPKRNLLIVCACHQTALTWRLEAEYAGWDSCSVHPRELDSLNTTGQQAASQPAQADCVLWDDSCHDRLPMSDTLEVSLEQCRLISLQLPEAPIVASLALGHIAYWPPLQAVGVNDFFIKPSPALPLAEYLRSLQLAASKWQRLPAAD